MKILNAHYILLFYYMNTVLVLLYFQIYKWQHFLDILLIAHAALQVKWWKFQLNIKQMDEIHFQSVTIFRNCLSITRTVGQQRAMHCTSSPVHSCDVWSLISLKLKLIPTGAWNFASGPDIEPTILESQTLKLHPDSYCDDAGLCVWELGTIRYIWSLLHSYWWCFIPTLMPGSCQLPHVSCLGKYL